jgi:serine/threonine protein kinase
MLRKGGTVPDELAGRVIGGRFEVQGTLANDGFGLLLSALDRKADRLVSLRVVRSAAVANRLGPQLAVIANVEHPSLLAAFGVLRSGKPHQTVTNELDASSALIVQGALQGQSIGSQIGARGADKAAVSLSDACHVVRQVVAALTLVHESGPHGVVGPDTVWTDAHGGVLLTDLALARAWLETDAHEGDAQEMREALFLAPEIKRGGPASAASDVFGLSATLYCLLAGRAPTETFLPPSKLHAEVTSALDEVLRRGLSADPSVRQVSPVAFEAALLEALSTGTRGSERTRKREISRAKVAKPAAPASSVQPVASVRAPRRPQSPAVAEVPSKFDVALLPKLDSRRPALRDVVPAKPDVAPRKSDVAPAKRDVAPAKRDVAPRKSEIAPAKRDVAPPSREAPAFKREIAALKREIAAARRESIAAQSEVAPRKSESVPARRDVAPVRRDVAPRKSESAPARRDVAPVRRDVAPRKSESAPARRDVAPVRRDVAPRKSESAPAKRESVPVRRDVAPARPTVAARELQIAPPTREVRKAEQESVLPKPEAASPTAQVESPPTRDVRPPKLHIVRAPSDGGDSSSKEEKAAESEGAQNLIEAKPVSTTSSPSALPDVPVMPEPTSSPSGEHKRAITALVVASQARAWRTLARLKDAAQPTLESAARSLRAQSKLSMVRGGLGLLLLASFTILIRAQASSEHDRTLLRAQAELAALREGFDRKQAERALKAQADALGRAPFVLETKVRQKRGRAMRATTASQTAWVSPLSEVTLQSLQQIDKYAQPGSAVTVHVLDAEALASSLSWRLSRTGQGTAPTLKSVELYWADVSQQDLDLEREVLALHEQSVQAQKALGARRVARSRRPVRGGAARLLNERKEASAAALARYEEAAQRAESQREATAAPRIPGVAVARVTVAYEADDISLDVPVPVMARSVTVTPLLGVELTATRATGSWDTLKHQSADAAAVILTRHIPWHAQPLTILGTQVRRIELLRIVPGLLLALIGILSFQMLSIEARGRLSARLRSAASSLQPALSRLYVRASGLLGRLRRPRGQ